MNLRNTLATTLFLLLTAAAVGHAQLRRIPAGVTPIVESDGVRAGAVVRAALQIQLPERFHTNSNKPREPFLIPTVLTVQPPPGIAVTEIVYPAPSELRQQGADQPLSVFEREFAIGVQLTVARDAPAGEIVVPVTLRYQACDEKMCYAPTAVSTSWTLRVVPRSAAVTALHADVFKRIAFGRGEAPPAEATATAAGTAASDPAAMAAPPPAGERAATLDDFEVLLTAGGYLGADDFLRFIRNAETGVRDKGIFEDRGLVAILFLVLLGGLALNLTPCVLPMIPINLAIIGAGAQAGSRARGFLLGATYGAAMAFVYGVLGLVVILTAGTFGAINASPWFNLGIAVLFVVLALAMFDVLAIDFSRFSSGLNVGESGRGTFLVAFAMGAVAALLAGACVAPVVIQVVLFSSNLYATGTRAALALPFLLGVGMALPWPIAGAGIATLPKPGAWMVRIKQVFGVVILATAAYYGYTAYGIFANRWVDPLQVSSSVEEKLKEGWHATLSAGLAEAKRDRKPVLIDFWATWCKNCLVMDRTTLKDPDVTAALANYVKIKFQAEDPEGSPAKEVLDRVDAIGLPTYAILKLQN
jgi:cytochrome c biogenesis protein CcdA/DsbC/DsbD-like thiol-disulfide interchange protein/thiol-disulfide isomerase/thioredoxin